MAGFANDLTQLKLLRLKDVLCQTGLSRSSLYRLIAQGDFPKAIALGEKSRAWVSTEVLSWIEKRIELRDTQEIAS